MNYDKDHQDWEDPSSRANHEPQTHIDYGRLPAAMWCYMITLGIADVFYAVLYGSSIAQVNPIAEGVFLGDLLPFLPDFIGDMSMNLLINASLGGICVGVPAVLAHFATSPEFVAHPKRYFERQPVRIGIAVLLLGAWGLTVSLEILALQARINASLYTGAIGNAGPAVQAAPMFIASAVMLIASVLLGLATAVVRRSIIKRYSIPIR